MNAPSCSLARFFISSIELHPDVLGVQYDLWVICPGVMRHKANHTARLGPASRVSAL